jgi:hypothetical protein
MIDDWVKTKILFWSLNVWIISLNFSNAFSMLECLISFTKRKLKIRTSKKISVLLTDKKISFSSKSTIFCCLDAVNWNTVELVIELSMYAVETEYFLGRPRSRLIGSMNTIDSIVRLPWDSTFDSTDDSIDDSIDEADNSSLVWSFW